MNEYLSKLVSRAKIFSTIKKMDLKIMTDIKLALCKILYLLFFVYFSLWYVPLPVIAAMTESSKLSDNKKPVFSRIISLYGAHTENLFTLGLDDRIVGVSRNEVYPQKALEKPVFSYRDDVEKILAVMPDLVLIRPMIYRAYKPFVKKLERTGIKVVSIQPSGMDGLRDYWLRLGELTGNVTDAQKMFVRFKECVSAIESLVSQINPEDRKKVYFEAIHRKMKTFHSGSMAIFALKTAGGINIAEDAPQVRTTNIASFGKERILEKSDKIDVYLAQTGTMNRITEAMIEQETGFHIIKAVREKKVYLVDEQIVSRPTLRLILGILEIGSKLYPDLFTMQKRREIIDIAGIEYDF